MRFFILAAAGFLAASAACGQQLTIDSLRALDTDADGSVDAGEFDAFVAKAFHATDANEDGFITGGEAEGLVPSEVLDATDTDGDGMLSLPEFTAQAGRDFTAADRDGDGALD
jgi:Ca2+-binding EF-hand superfamily protein